MEGLSDYDMLPFDAEWQNNVQITILIFQFVLSHLENLMMKLLLNTFILDDLLWIQKKKAELTKFLCIYQQQMK